jgi:hypothetical protein
MTDDELDRIAHREYLARVVAAGRALKAERLAKGERELSPEARRWLEEGPFHEVSE